MSRIQVSAFTEPQSTEEITLGGNILFAKEANTVKRWDFRSGKAEFLPKMDAFIGQKIISVGYGGHEDALWIAAEKGLYRFVGKKRKQARWKLFSPPKKEKIQNWSEAILHSSEEGGVWVGLPQGLFIVQSNGRWRKTKVTKAVKSIVLDRSGVLWVGTEVGLLRLDANNQSVLVSTEIGCDFSFVQAMVPYSDEGVFFIANDSDGKAKMAIATADGCLTYDDTSGNTWLGIAGSAGATFGLSTRGVYKISFSMQHKGRSQKTNTSFASFAANKGEQGPLIELSRVSQLPTAGVTSIASSESKVFVGTKHLGIKFWEPEYGKSGWLRTNEISKNAFSLSTACIAPTDCFIATGTKRIWRWDGSHFTKIESEQRMHGVLKLQGNRVLLLKDIPAHRNEESSMMGFYETNGSEWVEIKGVQIKVPGVNPRVRVLRQGLDGLIWLALSYEGGGGGRIPFGVAVVDLELGSVWYHRESFDERIRKQGILPVPASIFGIGFTGKDTIWLASKDGVSRVTGQKIRDYKKTDGVRGGVNSLACMSDGDVYVASDKGVGVWNGERFYYPRLIQRAATDLAIGRDGKKLWIATKDGIGIYSNLKLRVLNKKDGLIDSQILAIESDEYGRFWALSEQGIVLMDPN